MNTWEKRAISSAAHRTDRDRWHTPEGVYAMSFKKLVPYQAIERFERENNDLFRGVRRMFEQRRLLTRDVQQWYIDEQVKLGKRYGIEFRFTTR